MLPMPLPHFLTASCLINGILLLALDRNPCFHGVCVKHRRPYKIITYGIYDSSNSPSFYNQVAFPVNNFWCPSQMGQCQKFHPRQFHSHPVMGAEGTLSSHRFLASNSSKISGNNTSSWSSMSSCSCGTFNWIISRTRVELISIVVDFVGTNRMVDSGKSLWRQILIELFSSTASWNSSSTIRSMQLGSGLRLR